MDKKIEKKLGYANAKIDDVMKSLQRHSERIAWIEGAIKGVMDRQDAHEQALRDFKNVIRLKITNDR